MFKNLLVAAVVTVISATASAQATRADATAIVEKAAAYAAKAGPAALLAEVNAGSAEWASKDLFVIVYDDKFVTVGHPYNPKMLGKGQLEIPDVDGKYFRKEIAEGIKTKGSGWSEYRFKNIATNKVENKVTYYKKAGDLIILAGVFSDAK